MQRQHPSASFAALLVVAVLAAGPLGASASPSADEPLPLQVGALLLDATGRASGANVAASIDEATGVVRAFSHVASGTTVFESVQVDGFSPTAPLDGVGSSKLILRGTNAILSLHDDLHGVLKVRATAPTSVIYRLADGLSAVPAADGAGLVTLRHPVRGPVGSLVAYGVDGPATRGETLLVDGQDVVARVQPGSELLFLSGADAVLLDAIRDGLLVSHLVTASDAAALRTSQVDAGVRATARTTTRVGAGAETVVTALLADATTGALLAYDLSDASLPALGPADVLVAIEGLPAPRVATAADVLAAARLGVAAYHAAVEDGRARVLVATPSFALADEHRIVVSDVLPAPDGTDAFGALRLTHEEGAIQVHASAGGQARLVALRGTTVGLALAAGLRAEPHGESVVRLVREDGSRASTLVLRGAGAIEARAERELAATLAEGSELILRVHADVEAELEPAEREALDAALAAGQLGGAVLVAGGEAAAQGYGDLTLLAKASRDRVDLTLDSATHVGRTVLVALDPDTLPGLPQGRASIRLDGEAVAQASSLADVLDPTDDGDRGEALVLAGDAGSGVLVLVSVPHFSVREVTLEETRDHPNSLYMYATMALAVIVVVEAILLARGRLQKQKSNDRRPDP